MICAVHQLLYHQEVPEDGKIAMGRIGKINMEDTKYFEGIMIGRKEKGMTTGYRF